MDAILSPIHIRMDTTLPGRMSMRIPAPMAMHIHADIVSPITLTTTSIVDMTAAPRYVASLYSTSPQEAAHAPSLSDGRRRFFSAYI